MAKKKTKITEEVEKRFDEIFVEGEEAVDTGKEDADEQASPLRELKGIILSIEWEISDEVMRRFLDEVASLKTTYNGDRIMGPFFKMLDSLGRYIQRYKGKANHSARRSPAIQGSEKRNPGAEGCSCRKNRQRKKGT